MLWVSDLQARKGTPKSLGVAKLVAHMHARTYTYNFTALWTLSGITRVSRYHSQSEFY